MKNNLTSAEWLALANYLKGEPLAMTGEAMQNESYLKDFKAAKKKVLQVAEQLKV